MRSEPVLLESVDIKIWNKLDEIDSLFSSGKADKALIGLHSVVEEVSANINPIHSAVLVRILNISVRENMDDIQTIAMKIMEKCSRDDTYPALEVADIFVSGGNTDAAEQVLKKGAFSDKAFLEYVLGRMYIEDGDTEEAEKHFLSSYRIDPLFVKTYDQLVRMYPDRGWGIMRNIAVLMSGGETPKAERSFSDTDLESLYRIYWEWFRGDKAAAKNMLSVSANSDNRLEFRIAAARIFLLDNDIDTSLIFYRDVHQHADVQHIKTEFANVLTLSGRAEEALPLLREVEESDPLNRRMLEYKMQALSALGKVQETKECVSAFMRTEHADRDGYELCARMLSQCGDQKEAGRIVEILITKFHDDPKLFVLASSIEFSAGRMTSALEFADEAVKISSKDPDCRYQRAKVLSESGKMKKALRDIDAALSADRDHIPSHTLLKDIRMEQGDHLSVIDICDKILAIDPNNADIMRDKAYALDAIGDPERSLKEYRNALRTRQNQALFEDVLLRIVKRGRYEEMNDLCEEFSGNYNSSAMMWRLKGNSEYACGKYKEAMESFGKAVELSPYEPQIWHSKGMAAEMIGQLKRAEESFDKALLLDLDSKEFWLSKAVIQEKRGNLKGAVLALNRVISESPDSVFALVRKAMILARIERYDEAIFFIDLALKINSRDVSVHEMKIEILKHISRHEQIIRAADELLLIDSKNIPALTNKTGSHLSLGEYQKAKITADRALKIDPDSPEVLKMKKTALHHLGDNGGVADVCRRILEFEPDNRQLKMELAVAMADDGDKKGAMEIYDKLSADDPLDLKVIAMKSKVRSNMGEGSMAAELIQEVLDNKPKDPETLSILADVMIQEGYSEDAIHVLDTAIKLNPSDVSNYKLKAQVLMKDRKYEEAQKVLTDALRMDLDDAQIWWFVGEVQEVRRDMQQALLSYDSAMKLGMDVPELYFRRGNVQEALGMDEAAINSYSIAAVKDPKNAKALVKTAELQIKMDRMNAAEQNLDSALEIDPDLPEALFTLAKIYMAKGEEEDARDLYKHFISMNSESGMAEEFCDLVGADILTVPSKRLAESERKFRDEIEMYSHKILEHCYNTGYAITDEETFAEAGVPEGMRNDILKYLGSIEVYGDIDMNSTEFAKMESLSHELIMNDRITRIESEPLVSLSSAYMASGARSIDEAKKLIAFIYKVMTEDIEQDVYPEDVLRVAEELSTSTGDVTVFGIMESFDIGICCARMSKMLSAKMSDSVAFHV